MTAERSYADMNRYINAMVPRGRVYYMAGATAIKPTVDIAKRVSALQAALLKDIPQLSSMIGFELFSLKQVNKVPNDAMAFCCRGRHINVVLTLIWGHEGEGGPEPDLEQVRARGKEMIKAIQGDRMNPETPYGNYGEP